MNPGCRANFVDLYSRDIQVGPTRATDASQILFEYRYLYHKQNSLLASKMPSSALLHAACFAAGALVGGGVVTAVSSRRHQIPTSVPTVDAKRSGIVIPPIVEVGPNGAKITNAAAAVALASPALKYGNPGKHF